MSLPDRKRDTIPWYRQPYVWMILFFPLLAVVGGVTTMILAVRSYDGLVVDDYYKRGLEINRVLERDQLAEDFGLDAEIAIHPGREELSVTLSAASAFEFPPAVEARLLHATRAGLDREARLVSIAPGVYRGDLSALPPGRWYLHLQQGGWRLIETVRID